MPIQTAMKTAISLMILASFAAAQMEITRSTIDGGGVMRSSGGAFELSGTIGQPDAGTMVGGFWQLTGGFWFQIPPGDCNDDGILGLSDHDAFVECLTGPAGYIADGCACFDVDGSGAIDLADFSENQRRLLGE